jgi:hypothetical protein
MSYQGQLMTFARKELPLLNSFHRPLLGPNYTPYAIFLRLSENPTSVFYLSGVRQSDSFKLAYKKIRNYKKKLKVLDGLGD